VSQTLLNEARKEPSREPGTFKSKGLSIPEIALICVYTNQHCDSSNANEILNKYNPHHTSGRKLIEKYSHFLKTVNRKNLTESKSADRHRKNLLQKVVSYLENNGLEATKAKNELQILSDSIDSRY
jgi:hypothetical protein